MSEWDGKERRSDDLATRVRDLEENDRVSSKSRQAMHKQLGELTTKMDLVLERLEEKNTDCVNHKIEMSLLKQAHNVLTDTISKLADDQKWATRAATTGLIATTGGLAAYIWKVMINR
jgi:chromosome segregation ATPase